MYYIEKPIPAETIESLDLGTCCAGGYQRVPREVRQDAKCSRSSSNAAT